MVGSAGSCSCLLILAQRSGLSYRTRIHEQGRQVHIDNRAKNSIARDPCEGYRHDVTNFIIDRVKTLAVCDCQSLIANPVCVISLPSTYFRSLDPA